MSADVTFDIVTASICAALILVRCGYRLFWRCRVHESCHRTWHVDDAYMAFALIPLIGRTTCISVSFVLNPTHTYEPATEEAAAARNLTVEKLAEYYVISHKLLIPARIFYALLYVAYICARRDSLRRAIQCALSCFMSYADSPFISAFGR
ncbi:integral membrane protein [Colletotrichum tofieldiae]|nr:integral membrane protein [Colletotrichum tofieldiae]GKT72189.1 integral membrane protein [Colletotrichum tofieldiae]GKT90004.1 integral membrane protein [Colletotrichum tofieldiae]